MQHDVYDRCKFQFCYVKNEGVKACCLAMFVFDNKAICVGYKPPKSTWTSIKYNFETLLAAAFSVEIKVLVIVDFYVDFLKHRNKEFFLMLKKL